nr:hypothetical protein [Lacisediminihabitans profunda]
MFRWNVQWKAKLPGVDGAVNVAVAPPWIVTSNDAPSSEVTVCAWLSVFVTVTVAPGATEAGAMKVKSLMRMASADVDADAEALAAGGWLVPDDGLVLPPDEHPATNSRIAAAAAMIAVL